MLQRFYPKARNIFQKNEQDIINIYSAPNGSMSSILEKYPDLNLNNIRKFLIFKGFNIKKGNLRKMNYDRSYFKRIDSHEKAYWLGYIYADGNIHRNSLRIVSTDKGHLDHFKSAIKAEQAVREYKVKNCSNINHFSIGCPDLIKDLNALGVFERKSMELKFPSQQQVPDAYINSFMLGYFDGDGSIVGYLPKIGNRKWNFSIISTQDFCDKYNKILSQKCNLFESKITKYKRIPTKDIWEIHISGVYSDRIKRIYDFLYSNFPNPLSRKKERFLDFIKNNPTEPYSSQYYGVSKSFGKWQAQIRVGGKTVRLGRFEKEEDAARHYDKTLVEKGLDLRYLNFPQEHNAK